MQKKLTAYLSSAQGLNVTEQNHLRQLVERYPYFAAARLLLLRALFQAHDTSFSSQLRESSIYLPSLSVLYALIEGDRLKPNPSANAHQNVAAKAKGEEDTDRTGTLIDSFLETLPQEKTSKKQRLHPVDATVDYMAYLVQMEELNAKEQIEKKKSEKQSSSLDGNVEDFLRQNEGHIELVDRPAEEMKIPNVEEETTAKDGIFTETLARIYIKQGKFDKALEIIRKLSLKYPKKNRYFADQMRFLEKLIINSKNNK